MKTTGDTVQLRRIFRVVNGGTPTKDPENWNGEIVWVTPEDLGRHGGMWIQNSRRQLSDEGLRSSSNLVPRGSIVLSTRENAVTVTADAVMQGPNGSYVYVLSGDDTRDTTAREQLPDAFYL